MKYVRFDPETKEIKAFYDKKINKNIPTENVIEISDEEWLTKYSEATHVDPETKTLIRIEKDNSAIIFKNKIQEKIQQKLLENGFQNKTELLFYLYDKDNSKYDKAKQLRKWILNMENYFEENQDKVNSDNLKELLNNFPVLDLSDIKKTFF